MSAMGDAKASAADMVAAFGFTERHWIRKAAAGQVPGARQPFGPKSSWCFDLAAARKWWDASTKETPEWPKFTSAAKSGGAASRRMAKSSAPPSRRDLKQTLAKLSQSGKPA
jgi:hypothetical protein